MEKNKKLEKCNCEESCTCNDECDCNCDCDCQYDDYLQMPLIGDDAPAFEAQTTQGPIAFPQDYQGK